MENRGQVYSCFLDDGLGVAADYTKARISSLSVHADLLKSGFVPNEEKSLWEPTQVITWFGSVIVTCGKIISLGNCVGNVDRLMIRNIFAVKNSAMNWNSMVSLTPGCVDELNFWKVNLVHINGVPLWPIKVANTVLARALADAIQRAHKDCRNKHAVDTAIILFAQCPLYLCYFSS